MESKKRERERDEMKIYLWNLFWEIIFRRLLLNTRQLKCHYVVKLVEKFMNCLESIVDKNNYFNQIISYLICYYYLAGGSDLLECIKSAISL